MAEEPLRLATREEITETLGYALRYNRAGKRHDRASDMMARIAADILVEQLEVAGFVIMKKPPRPLHSDATHRPTKSG